MANKIKPARGTKTRIEAIKATLETNEIVYATDTGELGVKNSDGTVTYIGGGGTTYTEMTQSDINTGTSTTSMVISPKLLKDNVTSMINNAIIAGINGGY